MARTIENWAVKATKEELRSAIKGHKEAIARTSYKQAKKAMRSELKVMRNELASRR